MTPHNALVSLIFIALPFGCATTSKSSTLGESCSRSADCADKLRCIAQKCVAHDGLAAFCEHSVELYRKDYPRIAKQIAAAGVKPPPFNEAATRGNCVLKLARLRAAMPTKVDAFIRCAQAASTVKEMNEKCAQIAASITAKQASKAKLEEATEGLDKIKAGARSFFQADHYDNVGNLLPKAFPTTKPYLKGSTASTTQDSGWTPPQPCCQQPGKKCAGEKVWDASVWRALQFRIAGSHDFQFRFTSRGLNTKATYTAEARADLDCTGVYTTYKITAAVDAEYEVVVKGPIITRGK
ncbi:MAG: hypothetical protein KC503_34715 [Myxococcales bacterium]|nr:hypothetical protein [Myxococcales bacterium]